MANYTQAGRMLAVTTPLGNDVLLLRRFSGTESLSRLFQFELEMLAKSTTEIAFDEVLGQNITVAVTLPDGSTRFFNGIVSRFSEGHRVPSAQGTGTLILYRAEMVPLVWKLAKKVQSRIFQQLSVPDILKQVLTGVDIANQLQGTYFKRDYCVQYHETDFNFACRLMEEEGIYFFFKHTSNSHKMILADTPQSHPDVPGRTTVPFEDHEGGLRTEDRVHGWEKSQEILAGKFRLWDQCFELPGKNFEAVQPTIDAVQSGTVSHKLKVANNDQLEVYEFPGAFAQRFDGIDPSGGDRAADVQNIFTDSKRTAMIRMQQETTAGLTISGTSICRQFASGCRFTLDGHFNANGQYVLTSVHHNATVGEAYTTGNDSEAPYTNRFQCIPFALPFKPSRTTPRPIIEGTQTAVVVGPSGQEIFTDKYGRVKVQFPWDRLGKNDANSSCWIRVASPWAGQQWGMVYIPRIGQEVVVAFEEGDPDRPIIVGSVYNAQNMPPYTLPENMTQSGFLSRSTTQGTADNFNQLRFEEKKGSEEIYFHAEKDFNHVVENNHTLQVGQSKQGNGDQTISIFNNRDLTVGAEDCEDGSQSTTIFNNDTLTVGSSDAPEGSQTITIYKNRTATIQTGNETVTVQRGNRNVAINQGDDNLNVNKGLRYANIHGDDGLVIAMGDRITSIKEGNDTLTIGKGHRIESIYGYDRLQIQNGSKRVELMTGNYHVNVHKGDLTLEADIGSVEISAMKSLTLEVGQNSITINQQGITIQGMNVSINGQIQTQVQGAIVQVSGSATTQISGGLTLIG